MESQNTTKLVTNGKPEREYNFKPGHAKMGGREKGTPNRYTRLKHIVLDIIENRKEELGTLAFIDLLRVGASFVPKELKGEGFGTGNTKIIIVRPDTEKDEQPESTTSRIPKEIAI